VDGAGDGILIVGGEGPGTAALLDGAHATTVRVYLGLPDLGIPVPVPVVDPDPLHPDVSRGSAVVGGAGTEWRNAGVFQVGGLASADLLVDSGALLDTGRFEIFGNPTIQATEPVSTATFAGAQTQLKVTDELTAGGNSRLTFDDGAQFTADLMWLSGGTTILNGAGTSGQVNGTQTAVQLFRDATLIIEDGAVLNSVSVRHIIGAGSDNPDPALVHVRGAGSSWDMGLTDLLIAINEFGVDGGNGELRLEDGAYVRAHDIQVGTGGRITGSDSTIDANVNLLGGTIAPGLSPGVLTINGNFTQGPLSTLEIEFGGLIAGTQHDQLIVLGDVDFDGEILLKFIDGFAPEQGQQFEFLTVDGLADLNDATFEVRNLAPGFMFDITPSAGGIMMTALNDGVFVPDTIPGDFNANGVVDAADYVVWRKSGASPEAYDEWRANFGSIAGAAASLMDASVPEPQGMTLFAISLCAMGALRLRQPC
jgi:T5SS/PEP-CTERM-associated repeat protein